MKIRRLNTDNSWQIEWQGENFLLDPWLSGPEIDGFRAFNIQWHNDPPVEYEDLGDFSHVLISQPYSDHCHQETLQKLPGKFSVFGVKPALKKINRWIPGHDHSVIPDWAETPANMGNLRVCKMSPARLIDPIYHALLIFHGDEFVFYSPHGFKLSAKQAEYLKNKNCRLLITTSIRFDLPFFLGGVINPGPENLAYLSKQLEPDYVVNSHDAQKRAEGLVMKLAKVNYGVWPPDGSGIAQFEDIRDYGFRELVLSSIG